jgi:hypothetical protein
MKKFTAFSSAALLAMALTTSALANGQGSPVEPAPMPAPTQLEPAGPAPAATVEKTQSSQNWWLIALAAVIIIAIIIIASDDDDDDDIVT